ncbi:MAG: hypothetical protein IPO80_13145 [Propionibacteriaceae bacterium]|nr:hypothetical protein [Propionibacteriaceae bacterium]
MRFAMDLGSQAVVAGDHDDPDVRSAAGGHGLGDLRARRVGHHHESDQRRLLLDHVLGQVGQSVGGRSPALSEEAVRDGQNPQSVPREPVVGRHDVTAVPSPERRANVIALDRGAQPQNLVGSTFDVRDARTAVLRTGQLVDRGHALAAGIEGEFPNAGLLALQSRDVDLAWRRPR